MGAQEARGEPRPIAVFDAKLAPLPITRSLAWLKRGVDFVLDQNGGSLAVGAAVDHGDVGLAVGAKEAAPRLYESGGRLTCDLFDEAVPKTLGTVIAIMRRRSRSRSWMESRTCRAARSTVISTFSTRRQSKEPIRTPQALHCG